MASVIGKLHEFRIEDEEISAYIEWVELYFEFEVNEIHQEKQAVASLTAVGGKTYSLLRNLVAPQLSKKNIKFLVYCQYDFKNIDFKNSKWLTYFCILLCIYYCFSHLTGLLSVTWLSLLYKFTRFFIYFLFLSDEGPLLETLDYSIVLAVHQPFYISICISTLPTQHTTFISKEKSFAQLKEILKAHVEPKPLVIAERFCFHQRSQQEIESFQEYVTELKRMAKHCNFRTYLNEVLRDRLVCGLRNKAVVTEVVIIRSGADVRESYPNCTRHGKCGKKLLGTAWHRRRAFN